MAHFPLTACVIGPFSNTAQDKNQQIIQLLTQAFLTFILHTIMWKGKQVENQTTCSYIHNLAECDMPVT